jgi:hypothetical protein
MNTKAKQKKTKDHTSEDFLFYNTHQDESEFRDSLMIELKNNQTFDQKDQFSLYNQSFN